MIELIAAALALVVAVLAFLHWRREAKEETRLRIDAAKEDVAKVEGRISRARTYQLSCSTGSEAVTVTGDLNYSKTSGYAGPLDSNPRGIYTWQRYETPAYMKMEDPPNVVVSSGHGIAISSPDIQPGFTVWHGVKVASPGSFARHTILMSKEVYTDVGGTNGWLYALLKGKLIRNINGVNHMRLDKRMVTGRLAVEMAAADVAPNCFAIDGGRILRHPFMTIVMIGSREDAEARNCEWVPVLREPDHNRRIIFCSKLDFVYAHDYVFKFSESAYRSRFKQVVVRRVRPLCSFPSLFENRVVGSNECLIGCAFVFAASNTKFNGRDSWKQYLKNGAEFISLPLSYVHPDHSDYTYGSSDFAGYHTFLPFELGRFMSTESLFHFATPQSKERIGDHIFISKRPIWSFSNTTNWLVKFGASLKRRQLGFEKRSLMLIRAALTFKFISTVRFFRSLLGQESLLYVGDEKRGWIPVDTSGHLINWLILSESGLVSNRNIDHWYDCMDHNRWEGGRMYHNALEMVCALKVYLYYSVGQDVCGWGLSRELAIIYGEFFLRLLAYKPPKGMEYKLWTPEKRAELRANVQSAKTLSVHDAKRLTLELLWHMRLTSRHPYPPKSKDATPMGTSLTYEELKGIYHVGGYSMGSGVKCFSFKPGESYVFSDVEIKLRVNYLRGLAAQ
jgi:hypothetical protein